MFSTSFPKRTIAISARRSTLNDSKIRNQINYPFDNRYPSVTLSVFNI